MKVFIDTEFTEFDLSKRELISVAFCSESGEKLYVEVPFRLKNCSQFVIDNIIPLLEGLDIDKYLANDLDYTNDTTNFNATFMSKNNAKIKTIGYLDNLHKKYGDIVLISDAVSFDMPLIVDLIGDFPAYLSSDTIIFDSALKLATFELNLKHMLKDYPREHHAMDDAIRNMLACKKSKDVKIKLG